MHIHISIRIITHKLSTYVYMCMYLTYTVCADTYTHTHTCVLKMLAYMCIDECMYRARHMSMLMYVDEHACIYICIYIYICILCVHIHVCMASFVHANVCVYIYIQI